MTQTASPSFAVVDPRPIASDTRYTFFLPSEIEIAAVVVGGLVKLMFEYPHQKETWAAERMWVEVKRIDDGALLGSLGNVPDEPTSPLQKGDLVSFKSSDILAISWTNPASAPQPPEYREYWERCLLDECVLEGGKQSNSFTVKSQIWLSRAINTPIVVGELEAEWAMPPTKRPTHENCNTSQSVPGVGGAAIVQPVYRESNGLRTGATRCAGRAFVRRQDQAVNMMSSAVRISSKNFTTVSP